MRAFMISRSFSEWPISGGQLLATIVRSGLNPATRNSYAGPMGLSPYTAATLATEGHVFCVGTLAQCLRRWNLLPSEDRADTYLKMGRDGLAPTILRGEQIAELATNAELTRG